MEQRKFYILVTTGLQIEIDELDFANLKGRVGRGQTVGWYMQRGQSMGEYADWRIQLKDVAAIWSNQPDPEERQRENIDVTKRNMPKVGERDVKEPPPIKCGHNWNNQECYDYVTTIVSGANRYYKQCKECEAKSPLVKKREVEIAMEASGQSLDDVPLIQ